MDNPPDHGCGPGEGRPHHAALARPQLGRRLPQVGQGQVPGPRVLQYKYELSVEYTNTWNSLEAAKHAIRSFMRTTTTTFYSYLLLIIG